MTSLEARNERRMRAYIEAWNDHDVEAIQGFISLENDQYTPDEMRSVCEGWFAAFPDLTHDIEELVADGDWVLGRLTLRGTHRGTHRGIPPTGNEVEVADHFSTRFEDGLIVEHHATADFLTLFEQLGESVSPDRTAAAEAEELVRRYFGAINDRDRESFVETMAEDFTYGSIQGPEEMADMDWRWVEAMDITWDIQSMHATEEFVTTWVVASDTHRGEILGLEPTGESFEVTAITLSRIEEGKIAEWWAEWDFAGLLNQLGVIDAPVYDN